jgi:hypothetical protein
MSHLNKSASQSREPFVAKRFGRESTHLLYSLFAVIFGEVAGKPDAILDRTAGNQVVEEQQ